jgi:hypothetical protein
MATEALVDERLDRIEVTLDLMQENLAAIRVMVDGLRSSPTVGERRAALTVVDKSRE